MGHTNTTPNYNLPQFLGSDKPAWLTDVNNAMSAIDTAIAAAKAAADNAGGAAAALATTVGGHTTQLETLSNTVTNQGASIVSQGNAINTISELIGNGTPTTTDHTLIGAVNELNAKEGDLEDLQTSTKTSLVAAINEVAQGGGSESESTTATAVGTDADGATIYKKVYKGTTLTNNQVLDASLTLSTVKSIRVTGSVTTSANIKCIGFTTVAGNDEYWADVEIDSTGLLAKVRNITTTSYYIVVEYVLAS